MQVCVTSGVLELLSDEDDESPMISFATGTCFGEISLVYNIPGKYPSVLFMSFKLRTINANFYIHSAMYSKSSDLCRMSGTGKDQFHKTNDDLSRPRWIDTPRNSRANKQESTEENKARGTYWVLIKYLRF